jgi:hypothetical protein
MLQPGRQRGAVAVCGRGFRYRSLLLIYKDFGAHVVVIIAGRDGIDSGKCWAWNLNVTGQSGAQLVENVRSPSGQRIRTERVASKNACSLLISVDSFSQCEPTCFAS